MEQTEGSAPPGHLLAGRYRIHELLGEGGMGTVWRATDELLGRVVAVKRVRLMGLPDAEAAAVRQRTLREARIAATLHHPHVVTVFDVVTADDEPWLILEYVRSRTLAGVLRDRGTLPASEVAAIGAQVATALAAAHAAGVVHRDVKPDNVLLVERPDTPDHDAATVKLTDFGISHATGAPNITGTNVMSGTPAYFAPETVRGAGTDSRSDVYSLGATLYEAVEGVPPFGRADQNVFALLARIAGGVVPAPTRAGPLAETLRRLTADDPAVRPSAAQAHHALRRLATELSAPAASAVAGTTRALPAGPERLGIQAAPARPRWRRRALLVASAVLGIAAVATAVIVGNTRDGPAAASPAGPTAALPAVGAITIADPRTGDPCSLTDTGPLAAFGSTRLLREWGALNGCWIQIALGGNGNGSVVVSLQAPPRPGIALGGTQEQLGQLTLARYGFGKGSCTRRLVLSDRNQVSVTATDYGSSAVELCVVADIATRSAVEALARGGIGTRVPLDANSALAGIPACGLLGAGDLAVVPGIDPPAPHAGFGGWSCGWGDGANSERTSVGVHYVRQAPFAAQNDGRAVSLGGRQGYVKEDNGCVVRVPQRSFTGDGGQPRLEVVQVVVRGPQSPDLGCQQATALATTVAAKLPPQT